jgi:Epoxide hydrolase N terminus
MSIQPFKIDISQATLDDLRTRLATTRWPSGVEDSGWTYGISLHVIGHQYACRHWNSSLLALALPGVPGFSLALPRCFS